MMNIEQKLQSLLNAANAATGKSDNTITSAISSLIDGQGEGSSQVKHGVYFLDYDGSLVTAWATDDVAGKTTLPGNPTHAGLVAQGWNWDLQHIKSYISAYENADVYVGQTYKTASGLTEADITLTKITGLAVTFNMDGNKDWGDGTTDALTTHTYTDYGDYTITCDGTSILSGTIGGALFGSTSSNVNAYWCTGIRIGENVSEIRTYSFRYCFSLSSVTLPRGIIKIGNYAFSQCQSLTKVIIPQGVTAIGNAAFNYCNALTSVSIPHSVDTIGNNVFLECFSLAHLTLPQDAISIGNSAFNKCYSLVRVTIPQNITKIESSTFINCHAITIYDFTSAIYVPSLMDMNAFGGLNGNCKIIVPDVLYDEWIAAENWAVYSGYIYKTSDVEMIA